MAASRKSRKPDSPSKAGRGKAIKDLQVQGKGPKGGKGMTPRIGSQSTGAGAGKVTF